MLINCKNYYLNKSPKIKHKTEKKKNHSGRNSSGRITIRFKSKSNIKKSRLLMLFVKPSTLTVFNRRVVNVNSRFSSLVRVKDLLFILGLLSKNFNFQVTRSKINNYLFFFRRLFFSGRISLQLSLVNILRLIQMQIELFYNGC